MIGVACIALLLAYGVACYLTGENLVLTWWHEWQLTRTTVALDDVTAASNPRASRVIVTLTTIPSRIDLIGPTIQSLLRQTVRPAEIRLCLPEWSERERCAYVVPPWLRQLCQVKIVSCNDEGPATKFIATLISVPADTLVVVVDDDRIYHPRLLEEFARLTEHNPDEVIAGAGWSVPRDLIDRPTTLWARLTAARYVPIRANQVRVAREVDIVQGVHAYAVRPRFFDLAALANLAAAPPAVRFVDDVWISAHAGVPRRVHPMHLPYTDFKPWTHRRTFNASALGANVNRAVRDEDRGNSVALRYFADRWSNRTRATDEEN